MRPGFAIRILRHPASVAVGCGAGLVLLATSVGLSGASLRTGVVPLGIAIVAGSFGLAFAQAGWGGLAIAGRLTRMAARLAAGGLALCAVFFFSLAALHAAGSTLLDSDTTTITALGTLTVSVVSIGLVPAAIVVFAVGVVRDGRCPTAVRAAGPLFILVMAAGLLAATAVSEPDDLVVLAVTLALLSFVVTGMSVGVFRARTSHSVNRPAHRRPAAGRSK